MSFKLDLHLMLDCADEMENETEADILIKHVEKRLVNGIQPETIMQSLAEVLIELNEFEAETMH
jgi:hypothetical protein|tara:strand:- start:103 stop:294 length:192 start_codon:yes stop_codon:yes gene_type:complete